MIVYMYHFLGSYVNCRNSVITTLSTQWAIWGTTGNQSNCYCWLNHKCMDIEKMLQQKFWKFKDMYLLLKLLQWTSVRKHGWRLCCSFNSFPLNWSTQWNSLRLCYPGLNTGACTFGLFSLKHMVLVYCGTWRSVPIVLNEAGNVLQLNNWNLHVDVFV